MLASAILSQNINFCNSPSAGDALGQRRLPWRCWPSAVHGTLRRRRRQDCSQPAPLLCMRSWRADKGQERPTEPHRADRYRSRIRLFANIAGPDLLFLRNRSHALASQACRRSSSSSRYIWTNKSNATSPKCIVPVAGSRTRYSP